MAGANQVIMAIDPDPVLITATDIGKQLASDSADAQAAILLAFARSVEGYGPNESWPMQCRGIAEELTNDECRSIATVLDTLVEHLNGVPEEREEG